MRNVNVGCGKAPVPGWVNYDNSLSVRLSHHPIILTLLKAAHVLNKQQVEFATFARMNDIKYADARERIPEEAESVDAVYASFLLARLDANEARLFLQEVWRILKRGGVVRIHEVDLRKQVQNYLSHGNSAQLLRGIGVTPQKQRRFRDRLKRLMIGERGLEFTWTYDERSLCDLLTAAGFAEPSSVNGRETRIREPGQLDLAATNLCVEAWKR